jgi:hypothetical protein
MTPEESWRQGKRPKAMLSSIRKRASSRQLRLFACAAARLYQEQLSPQGRQALEAAERFADDPAALNGMISAGLVVAAGHQLFQERLPEADDDWENEELAQQAPAATPADHLARATAYGDAWKAAHAVANQTIQGLTQKSRAAGLLPLLDEVFGDPFAPPAIDPAWLSWNDRTIEKLALAIYRERAFERMPVLGDALEEAACTNQSVLQHCRASPAERRHVRGCWVVELLLEASGRLNPSHPEGMAGAGPHRSRRPLRRRVPMRSWRSSGRGQLPARAAASPGSRSGSRKKGPTTAGCFCAVPTETATVSSGRPAVRQARPLLPGLIRSTWCSAACGRSIRTVTVVMRKPRSWAGPRSRDRIKGGSSCAAPAAGSSIG